MILLYRIITTLIYPFLVIIIFFRRFIKKEDNIRFKEKIFPKNFNILKIKDTKLIWFHAASIGEFKSIIPIIDELNKEYKNIQILITTVTLSSANLAEDECIRFDNVIHRFFPLDVEFLVKKFLESWKPYAIFLVDSEIWPNLILTAKKKKIPVCLINARITKKSFKRWMLFPKTAKKIFSSINLFLSSNLETKNFLHKLSIKNVVLSGNIKLSSKIDENKIKNPNEKILLEKKFWVAASTHEGEENLCLQTHLKLKKKYKNIITIIFPRHINRAQQIKKLSESFKFNTQILGKNDIFSKDKEIIIVNSFGELQKYFLFAKSVFIGKSMIKKLEDQGGQNPIDAAKLGCKIYHGPYVYNFKEVYKVLNNKLVAKRIEDSDELSVNLIKDLDNLPKNKSDISKLIDVMGKEILNNTMKDINSLIINEI